MTDVAFGDATFACGVQSAVGVPNAAIVALSEVGGALNSTDGIVLGDRESGEHNTGIAFPQHVREGRALADVGLTKQDDSLLRVATNGLQISIPLKGNGVTFTPSLGEAKPLAGIDALLQAAGWVGVNGVAPLYVYTLGLSTIYLTVKIYVGDLAYIYQDVTCERAGLVATPGGNGIYTFDLVPGKVNAVNDGVTQPVNDYGTQLSLDAPVIQLAGHDFGQVRGFNAWSWSIDNTIADIEDSNIDGGLRKEQDERTVEAAAVFFVEAADSDFDYAQLADAAAPSDAEFWQGGVVTTSGPINGFLCEMDTPRNVEQKQTKLGTALGTEVTVRGTASTAGQEARLTFN